MGFFWNFLVGRGLFVNLYNVSVMVPSRLILVQGRSMISLVELCVASFCRGSAAALCSAAGLALLAPLGASHAVQPRALHRISGVCQTSPSAPSIKSRQPMILCMLHFPFYIYALPITSPVHLRTLKLRYFGRHPPSSNSVVCPPLVALRSPCVVLVRGGVKTPHFASGMLARPSSHAFATVVAAFASFRASRTSFEQAQTILQT